MHSWSVVVANGHSSSTSQTVVYYGTEEGGEVLLNNRASTRYPIYATDFYVRRRPNYVCRHHEVTQPHFYKTRE
jgi:hypothetical protein